MIRRLFGRRKAATHPTTTPSIGGTVTLSDLAKLTDRVAVVDTETTGVYPSDRVVELAVVTMGLTGEVIDEWDSLIDPQRDVGPTWLHGISPSMLVGAPTFEEVAGSLAVRLQDAVLVAHNLPFDARMLQAEFLRLGVEVDLLGGLDTLRATGCKLHVACERYGVRLDGAHRALNDARATAQLLVHVAGLVVAATRPVRFLTAAPSGDAGRCLPRDEGAHEITAPPSWFAGLAASVDHHSADVELINYLDVLGRAMADLHLDVGERVELEALARELGLDDGQSARANRRWLDDFIAKACADGVVDTDEYDELCRAAATLGVDQDHVDQRTARQRTREVHVVLEGGTVCFTGEPVDNMGDAIPRSHLEAHARTLGFLPVDSVTKSGCGLLVAADAASQSGKASKARSYGIPIVAASDFLDATSGASLLGRVTTVATVDTLTCTACGRVWTRPQSRAHEPDLCPGCSSAQQVHQPPEGSARRTPRTPGPDLVATRVALDGTVVETLRCLECGEAFDRPRARGPKPTVCPSCQQR